MERLITRSHYQAIVFARCVIVSSAPVKHERLEVELFQARADVLCPMPAPPAFSHADIDQEHGKLPVQNEAVFACETARFSVRRY